MTPVATVLTIGPTWNNRTVVGKRYYIGVMHPFIHAVVCVIFEVDF